VFVFDRRYRERGVARAILEYTLMDLNFALGRLQEIARSIASTLGFRPVQSFCANTPW
jgi:hypothetical protein